LQTEDARHAATLHMVVGHVYGHPTVDAVHQVVVDGGNLVGVPAPGIDVAGEFVRIAHRTYHVEAAVRLDHHLLPPGGDDAATLLLVQHAGISIGEIHIRLITRGRPAIARLAAIVDP